jgi:hypothetical protein
MLDVKDHSRRTGGKDYSFGPVHQKLSLESGF